MLRVVSSSPRRIGVTAFPTSTPYIIMLAPAARSSVANLCFAGTSDSRMYDWESKEICSPRRKSPSAISTLSFESSLSTLFRISHGPVFSLFAVVYSHGPLFPRIVEHATRLVACSLLKRFELPELRRISAQHGISFFRCVLVDVILHNVHDLQIRSRQRAHRPIRSDHQPARSEAFERHV